MNANTVGVCVRRIERSLAISVVAFVAAYLLSQWAIRDLPLGWTLRTLLSRLDLDQEVSIPTWFSQSLLLVVAAILAIIARYGQHGHRLDRAYWTALAVIFTYLSIDEGSALHEIALEPMVRLLNIQNSFLRAAWIIPAGLLVICFAAVYWRFWGRLPGDVRWRFAVGGVTYVGGAVVVEAITGAFVVRYGTSGFAVILLRALEKGMELSGVCIFISGVLRYARRSVPPHQLPVTT